VILNILIVVGQAHWNEIIFKVIEQKGDKAGPMELYVASKTLAEKAGWKFMTENKDKVTFDLVTINPSYVSVLVHFFPE
jgi:hypothetical protein